MPSLLLGATVAQQVLALQIGVRFPEQQPFMVPSSNWLGHRPLKAAIAGSSPVGATSIQPPLRHLPERRGNLNRFRRFPASRRRRDPPVPRYQDETSAVPFPASLSSASAMETRTMPDSSNWTGRSPFKAVTRVRAPYPVPMKLQAMRSTHALVLCRDCEESIL